MDIFGSSSPTLQKLIATNQNKENCLFKLTSTDKSDVIVIHNMCKFSHRSQIRDTSMILVLMQ